MTRPLSASWLDRSLRRLSSGGTILCFHGIREAGQPDSGGIHVSEGVLRAAIALVAAQATVVPLRDVIGRSRSGRSTAGLVALTFDDACLSVSRLAAPVIREAGVHATIFAVRAASESGTPYWWDRLSLVAPLLTTEEWVRLFATLGITPVADGQDAARVARDAIITRHQGALPTAVDDFLCGFETRHGLTGRYDRAMSAAELVALASDPHFELGVHTATHRALPVLSDAEIEREIAGCDDWLRGVVGRVLPVLAVPYGLRDDRTAPLARRVGMEAVLRIAARNVMPRWDEAGLPRFSMSERRTGWKLRAALLGAYEWAYTARLPAGQGDPRCLSCPVKGMARHPRRWSRRSAIREEPSQGLKAANCDGPRDPCTLQQHGRDPGPHRGEHVNVPTVTNVRCTRRRNPKPLKRDLDTPG